MLELYDKVGYTTDDLIADNAEFGEDTVITKRWQFEVTLVYRLEKIKKLTGLDLREFDDAITFKVALMVKKYLTSRGIDS